VDSDGKKPNSKLAKIFCLIVFFYFEDNRIVNNLKFKARFNCFVSILSALAILALVGCAQNNAKPHTSSYDHGKQPDLVHTVRYSGETLALISNWYTKNSSNWREIQLANPGLEPTRMFMGQTIFIPRHLVVEESPLPQSYLSARSSRASEKKSDKSKQNIQVEDSPEIIETEKRAVEEATEAALKAAESADSGASVEETSDDEAAASETETTAELVSDAPTASAEQAVVAADTAVQSADKSLGDLEKASVATMPSVETKEPTQAEKEREKLLQELLSE
jgi:hypothetical protein